MNVVENRKLELQTGKSMKDVRGITNEIRSSLRKDRELYWSAMATQMEEASARNDMTTLFKFVRCRQNGVSEVLTDVSGAAVTDLVQKKALWI